MRLSCFFLIVFYSANFAYSQDIGDYLGDESALYAETKQINQFFRRFNCEEDLKGKRIYEGDENYHNMDVRVKYLNMLFDKENNSMDESVKDQFIDAVTNQQIPAYLDYYGGRWFAEVDVKFLYYGQPYTVVLFLELEKEDLGIKWVLTNVYFHQFNQLFYNDTTAEGKFLHPMSHELDFMNLIKVFKDKETVEYYFDKTFKPDFTTLFLYEVKKGGLVFQTIENVRFHFFQINDWYFEISEFNRRGNNTGWLISNLSKIPEDQKEMLLKYIYYEK